MLTASSPNGRHSYVGSVIIPVSQSSTDAGLFKQKYRVEKAQTTKAQATLGMLVSRPSKPVQERDRIAKTVLLGRIRGVNLAVGESSPLTQFPELLATNIKEQLQVNRTSWPSEDDK